jgi:phosphatidylserine/phosphatidylglycerophosphate/cardiolipin synthase-like enzyme
MKVPFRFLLLSLFFLPICISGCRSQLPISNSVPGQSATAEVHYSPEEDLERIDLSLIRSAQKSIDMPMYAFTDRYLAEAIRDRASHGVKIRLYRDKGQFEDEISRSSHRNTGDDAISILKGSPNIQIRVKGTSTLQHLKAYCIDGRVIRDGSANWSPTGEKRQDNSLVILTSNTAVQRFQQVFNEIWNREDNQVIQ